VLNPELACALDSLLDVTLPDRAHGDGLPLLWH
jgi:hypothetical protein